MTRHEQRKYVALDYRKNMTASGQYTNAEALIGAQGFFLGAEWADSHPIISKNILVRLIRGIKSGDARVLSEYSNSPELSKVFDDGQISAFELLLEWLECQQKGGQA